MIACRRNALPALAGLLAAGAVAAQTPDGPDEAVARLLFAVHQGNPEEFDHNKAPTATFVDKRKGRAAKPKPLLPSEISPFLRDCTLYGPPEGEGTDLMLKWKCGDDYSKMDFRVVSQKVLGVTVMESPPWIIGRQIDQIRFPDVVSAE